MAERRMMTKKIIHSDAFLDMPISTQNLYFHLLLEGDDEGFINSPKKVQRVIGASDDDVKILLAKKFIISFDSGIIVLKHWKMHNYIQKDRFKPTTHTSERALLSVKDNNVYRMDTECIQNGRVGKVSIGEVSIGEDSIEEEIKTEVLTQSQIDAEVVANYLLKHIKEFKSNFKQPNLKRWEADIEKAIRIDSRTVDQLISCINWIYSEQGSFWIPNIMSGKKLREKFDTMEAQMMQKQKQNNSGLDDFLKEHNAS